MAELDSLLRRFVDPGEAHHDSSFTENHRAVLLVGATRRMRVLAKQRIDLIPALIVKMPTEVLRGFKIQDIHSVKLGILFFIVF